MNLPDVLGKLLAIHLHLFDIDVLPEGGLPAADAGADNEHVVPKSLEEYNLFAALLQLLVVRHIHLKQARRLQQHTHLFLQTSYLLIVLKVGQSTLMLKTTQPSTNKKT